MNEHGSLIVTYLAEGNFRLTRHAHERMSERGASKADLKECGRTCVRLTAQEDGKFRVDGFDLEGDELSVICVLVDQVLVITLF